MYSLIAEIVRFLVYMYFILLIVYGRRDRNVALLNLHVYDVGFAKDSIDIARVPDVYDFVQQLLDDQLFTEDALGNVLVLETGYLLSPIKLRQFRMRPQARCDVSYSSRIRCVDKSKLDRADYTPSWLDADLNGTYKDTEWSYNSGENFPSHLCRFFKSALLYLMTCCLSFQS